MGMLAAAAAPDPCPPAWAWWAIAVAAVLVAATARGRVIPAALLAAAFALGGGWFTFRVRTPDPASLSRVLDLDGARPGEPILVAVEAIVTAPVRDAAPPGGVLGRFARAEARRWFTASVRTAELGRQQAPARGEVSVWVAGERGPAVSPGQRVRITGLFSPTSPPLNPGQPDLVRWGAQSGRVGSISVTDAGLITSRPHVSAFDALRGRLSEALWWFRARGDRAMRAATATGDARASALVRALILGESDPALEETTAAFSRLGVVHILSISGFHVSAMVLFASFLLRLLGERGRWQTALLAVPVAGYLLLAPAEAPVVRAGVLALVVIIAELLHRRYDPSTLLIWTSLAILVWRPMDLWSLGYQLSCGMTLVLLWLGPRVHDALWGGRLVVPGAWRRWTLRRAIAGWLKASLSAGLLCWTLSAPAVWCRTGLISVAAVSAGLLLAPIFAALMYAAFAALLVGLLIPAAAAVVAWPIGRLAHMAVVVADAVDALPGASLRAPPISGWAAAAITAILLACWIWGRTAKPGLWAALAAAVGFAAAGVVARTWLPADVVLRIDTLAVGDGACHVLRASSGDALLWDCGSLRAGLGVRELPAAMRALGIRRIPQAVVSHGDFDHYSALPDLAGPMGLRRVLVVERLLNRAAESPGGPVNAFLAEMRRLGVEVVPVAAGDSTALGSLRLTFLSPPRGAAWTAENDYSLVARVDGVGAVPESPALALFCGDIQSAAIVGLRGRFPSLRALVVEAPHHGSLKADAAAWVRTLSPATVLQSTGPHRLGPRAEEVWGEVRRSAEWFTTATRGAITTEVTTAGVVRTRTTLGGMDAGAGGEPAFSATRPARGRAPRGRRRRGCGTRPGCCRPGR